MEETIEFGDYEATIELDEEKGTARVANIDKGAVAEVRTIAENALTGGGIEISDVTGVPYNVGGDEVEKVVVELDLSGAETKGAARNAFAGRDMKPIVEAGYVPLSVGKDTAWFYPVEDVFDTEDFE
jgi:hypothetical protein